MEPRKILVMGDAHVTDEQDLSRFDAAGKFILEERPTDIILMGDFLTMRCLSAWDRDKRLKMEGLRYRAEIEAGNEALDRLTGPVARYNRAVGLRKKGLYQPNWVYIEGNHEDRLTRYLDKDPTFLGTVGIAQDLNLTVRGFTWIPYRSYHYINGIGFTHIPFNKMKEIGGVDITRKAQQVTIKSCVFGHTHELHTSNVHVEGMDHLQQVLNVGCFFEDHEEYTKGKVTNYWKGLVLLHNYSEQRFDIETISMSRLKSKYEATK